MRRAGAGLLALAAALGCGDAEPRAADEGARVEAGEAPLVDSVATRVFLREPAESGPPGRVTLHLIVPGDAKREQIRQALVRTLEQEAAADSALVAARAIAYVVAPPRSGAEAEVVPLAWGEWLPPGGWSGSAAGRGDVHRVTTYFGAPPEW
ncbi:MAG TPA: hypothetical protein VMK65_07195 [Longimicrobiales bacterium]|nr:hypothetical protein [Longimicrobiales bacterium]